MKLNALKLNYFRCFIEKKVSFFDGINVIFGPNASGKTTCLEATYSLAFSKSYRAKLLDELINKNKGYFCVQGQFKSESNRDIFVSFGFNKITKEIYVNEKRIDKISELIGLIKVILFTANDVITILGNPTERRKMFDSALSQISPEYMKNLINCRKLIKQKNAAIKQYQISKKEELVELINTYSEQIIEFEEEIAKARIKFVDLLNTHIQSIHKIVGSSNETLKIKYERSFKSENRIKESENKLNEELKVGYSLLGPHKDDYKILINNEDASKFASSGQKRSAILTIKLCIAKVMTVLNNDKPIILLDDVFSDLDEERQNNLINYLIDEKYQSIITSASISDIRNEMLNRMNIINIQEGEIKYDR